MEKIILNAQPREETGKTASKHMRQADMAPAVVYKHGTKTSHLQVKITDLIHILHTSAGENTIITLKIAPKGATKTVLIKEIQYHPIKETILHIDFQEISLTEKIKVNVPVVLRGDSVGVKTEGGVLEQITKELEIECLPTSIPQKIELNVEAMKIGDAVHVKELNVPADVKVLTDPEQPVVSISAQKEEEPAPAEGELAEEAAQEPEVISEKKAEEREAEKAAKEQEDKEREKEEKKE